ncbi:DUF2510 domain-containing protein [Nocardia rhizosphaerihabitans]|uniref:DUF2510 domain-containing protein n=1 Tax=Nocardia rhizosphaerihabitans TaxID=1691570 RepID=UPI003671D85A
MTQPQQPPPGMPPPLMPQQATPAHPAPLIPHWVVVVIAGGLLVTYMTANNFTEGEAIGLAIILGIGAIIVLVIRVLVRLGDKRPDPVVVNAFVALAPPGWYVDPQGATRWFDGRGWTEQVQPPS